MDDRKTLYLGSFEQEYRWDDTYDVDGTDYDDWRPMFTRVYVTGPAGVLGCYTFKSEHSNDPSATTGRSVFLSDYQGNLNVVVDDASGNVSAHLSNDAWGNRRDPITWARYSNPSQHVPDDADGHPLYRGYTGHEMLDDLGLIHVD